MTGMWAFVILLFTGVCYKFFVVSMIVIYIFMFGAGMLLKIGLHFFIPKGFIHHWWLLWQILYCSDRRSDTVWTYEAVL